jgi:hypothetical protein
MNKQQRFLLISGFLLVSVLALWLGFAAPRAYANVTLVSFTATSKPGLKDVYVYWETATEFDTVGFFVTRKDTLDGSFMAVSEFIPHQDSSGLVGAKYYFTDTSTTLNQVYYYILEEITPNEPAYYGPITVTAGIQSAAVPKPTPTPTRTPTSTSTPTATTQVNPADNPPASISSEVVVTPRVVTGATVTPRPNSSGGSSDPAAVTTAVAKVSGTQAQPQTAATSAPSAPDTATASDASQPAAAAPSVDVAQAPDPTLIPPDAVPAVSAPAVVVTEAAPTSSVSVGPTNGPVLVLVGAACLFLGIAFLILHQARQ